MRKKNTTTTTTTLLSLLDYVLHSERRCSFVHSNITEASSSTRTTCSTCTPVQGILNVLVHTMSCMRICSWNWKTWEKKKKKKNSRTWASWRRLHDEHMKRRGGSSGGSRNSYILYNSDYFRRKTEFAKSVDCGGVCIMYKNFGNARMFSSCLCCSCWKRTSFGTPTTYVLWCCCVAMCVHCTVYSLQQLIYNASHTARTSYLMVNRKIFSQWFWGFFLDIVVQFWAYNVAFSVQCFAK